MKTSKITNLTFLIAVVILTACGSTSDPNAGADISAEEEAVKEVMASYKSGIEALSVEGLSDLFLKKSEVFESGSNEGSFGHYLDHHLAPELEVFESFKFNDHKIKVNVQMPFAFTTETYKFKIVIKESGEIIERKGVATSILRNENGKWKIMKTHSSSRAMNSSH